MMLKIRGAIAPSALRSRSHAREGLQAPSAVFGELAITPKYQRYFQEYRYVSMIIQREIERRCPDSACNEMIRASRGTHHSLELSGLGEF
jgi:hypothetical protein